MKIIGEHIELAISIDQGIIEIHRMGRGEANPLNAVDRRDKVDQCREIGRSPAMGSPSIGIHVLPEQIDPYTGKPVSVSPLTWSHATVVMTVMEYLLKHAELTGGRSGILAELARNRRQPDDPNRAPCAAAVVAT